MKTALFGGSFDPVHIGHLFIAEAACSQLGYQKVLFIPTAGNPLKKPPRASAEHRYEMLMRALQENERFFLSDIEIVQNPPVFTIDTVQALYRRELHTKAGFIVGTDAILKKDRWKNFTDLEKLVDIIAAKRIAMVSHDYPELSTCLPDISSHYIRELLSAGHSVRYLVPDSVCDYITTHKLYE